jgi:hypothetical protein
MRGAAGGVRTVVRLLGLARGGLRVAIIALVTTRISRWLGITVIVGIARRTVAVVGTTARTGRRRTAAAASTTRTGRMSTATIISTKLMNLKLRWGKRRAKRLAAADASSSKGPADKTTDEGQVTEDVGSGGSWTPSNRTTKVGQTKNDVGFGGS